MTKSKRFSRRDFLRLSVAGATGAIVAACKPAAHQVIEVEKIVKETVLVEKEIVVEKAVPAEKVTRPPEPVELRLLTWWTEENRYMAQIYEETHPWSKIEIQPTLQNEMAMSLLPAVAAHDPPDLVWLDKWTGVWPWAEAGALMDMTPLIDASPHPEQEYFPQWTIDDYNSSKDWPKVPPGQYGWPVYVMDYFFYYNADMHKEVGLALPERGWTWSDFRENCLKMTDPTKKTYGYVLHTWMGGAEWMNWVWQNGGQYYDENMKCALTQPEAIGAFRFLQDLVIRDKAAVPPQASGVEHGMDFVTGNIAYVTFGSWAVDWIKRDSKFEWHTVMPPKQKQEAASIMSNGFSIPEGAKHPEEAWEFIKWITGYEPQVIAATALNQLPVHTRAAPLAFPDLPDEDREFITSLPSSPVCYRLPYAPSGPEFDANAVYDPIWLGDPVEDVLSKLCGFVDSAMSREGQSNRSRVNRGSDPR